ncbi:MAG: hypothetical protein JWR27_2518 [Aeromicrobium sp.]|nr:hypothetical protein [Aeromicrobium sp.]
MRPEDQLLAREQFPELNREFYVARSGPHDYIRARLRAIHLAASDSEAILNAAAEGLLVGNLKTTYPIEDSDPEVVQLTKRDFLVTESTVLFHHAGEALMRLYYAHVDRPECPRLEMARFRDFDEFKSRLAKLGKVLRTETGRSELMDVFAGQPTPSVDGVKGATADAWNAQCDGLTALLTTTADRLLRDKNLYNAAKHGLAVRSEELSVELGGERVDDQLTDVALSMSGPALHHLEVGGKRPRVQWQETTTWVSAESNLALTYLIAKWIETLMTVGRARYVRDQEKYEVPSISRELVEGAVRAGRPDGPLLPVSIGKSLLYKRPEKTRKAQGS